MIYQNFARPRNSEISIGTYLILNAIFAQLGKQVIAQPGVVDVAGYCVCRHDLEVVEHALMLEVDSPRNTVV